MLRIYAAGAAGIGLALPLLDAMFPVAVTETIGQHLETRV
jgi:hypothetical protein